MDAKYINPFVIATKSVFKAMLSIDLTIDRPSLKNSKTASGDVTGVMGLVGDKKGTVCISFKEIGALHIYKTLMFDEATEINNDVVDAIGELTNIISGQARKELEDGGINLKASIPTVVVGRDVELHFITKLPIISLPFHFQMDGNQETVYVDFSLE